MSPLLGGHGGYICLIMWFGGYFLFKLFLCEIKVKLCLKVIEISLGSRGTQKGLTQGKLPQELKKAQSQ
jgi:hypothetical protein